MNMSHIRTLETLFGTVWSQAGEREYKVTCPYCNTKALWINVVDGVFHCFSCQAGGRAEELIPDFFNLFPHFPPPFDKVVIHEGKPSIPDYVVLPASYKTASRRSDFPEGWDYIRSRGVSPPRVEYGSYGDRDAVLFPFRERGKIVYWQARRMSNLYKRKTQNPSGVIGKSNFLYRIDMVRQGEPILVVEGVFDALRTNSVASCGKTLSDVQIRKLLERRPLCVFVCYDGDAYEGSVAACDLLRKHGVYHTAIPVRLPEDKDPGDLGVETFDYVLCAIEEHGLRLKAGGVSVSTLLTWLRERRQIAVQVSLPLSTPPPHS